MEAAGTAPASAKDDSMRLRVFPSESISASGSVNPRGTLPAPNPPVDVPFRPRKLPVGEPTYEATDPDRELPGATALDYCLGSESELVRVRTYGFSWAF